MSVKLYKTICDTSLNGRFYRKGQEVQSLDAISNVNFKFIKDIDDDKKEIKKVSKK